MQGKFNFEEIKKIVDMLDEEELVLFKEAISEREIEDKISSESEASSDLEEYYKQVPFYDRKTASEKYSGYVKKRPNGTISIP